MKPFEILKRFFTQNVLLKLFAVGLAVIAVVIINAVV